MYRAEVELSRLQVSRSLQQKKNTMSVLVLVVVMVVVMEVVVVVVEVVVVEVVKLVVVVVFNSPSRRGVYENAHNAICTIYTRNSSSITGDHS